MERRIDKYLLSWKSSLNRKVLIIKGARQVGKTYSVRQFGKTFKHYVEVNFEEEKAIHSFFEGSLNPEDIIKKLSIFYGVPIKTGETLLFFDEIQSCPNAIMSLRFFYEKNPDLHIIAAGSLLEFVLDKIPSHGVGRFNYLHQSPMTFDEFLVALGKDDLLDLLLQHDASNSINDIFHNKLLEYFKFYQIIGGMPDVVKSYIENRDLLLCQQILDELILSFKDDFAKYKKRISVLRLQEVFQSVMLQAGSKFKYSNIDSTTSASTLKEALELLVQAGLVYKIYHTSARGIPLGAQIKTNKFKVISFDIGIHQRMLGLNLSEHITASTFNQVNKGSLAEVYVGQQLIHLFSVHNPFPLFYWHREAKSSNAEVDYVIQNKELIIPIEVKAGTKGQMQSINLFMNERKSVKGIRVSMENFSRCGDIEVIPLYAINKIIKGDVK